LGRRHWNWEKVAILFSGIILDDKNMKNIGFDYGPGKFQEDCQVYGNSWDKHWGERYCSRNITGNLPGYRDCCTNNRIVGHILAAHTMNATSLWNWDYRFCYQDSYMKGEGRGDWWYDHWHRGNTFLG
jgi:hypothetical protein